MAGATATSSSSSQTEAFDGYYEEFAVCSQQLATAATPEARDSLVRTCRELLQLAALEARGVAPGPLRVTLFEAVHAAKLQLSALQQVHERGELRRTESDPRRTSRANTTTTTTRQDQRLAQQNATLARATQTMQESEGIGLEITGQLWHNRETITSAHDKVNEVQGMTARAGDLLKSMTPWWRR
jgi:hypothetical protein